MQWTWAYRGARSTAWFAAAVCAIVLLCAQAARAGTIRQRILQVADQEIGYHDHGHYCTKFGPCETWCSLFVTWVWREAGVPVPSLAFTGYLYAWARDSTHVLGPRGVPQPGDAVLFGSGPQSVDTSLHTGVVEAVYPGYLVTIEGDSLHGVRRYVVPLRHPQLVGEPGPIYAYASPLGARGNPAVLTRSAATAFPAFSPALTTRQEFAPRKSSQRQRLLRAIAALRAFQHMPYRTAEVFINWTGVDQRGLVRVSVNTQMPMSYAINAWEAFLRRFDDGGHAYTVTFDAPPDPPAASSPPSISGTAADGQTLTESHGVWSNSPIAYTYQWEDCDLSGQSCAAISGATGQTYTLTATDVRHTIRVQELASNSGGAGQPATSDPTAAVAPQLVSPPPAPPSLPPDPGAVRDEITQPNPNPAGDSNLQRNADRTAAFPGTQ